MKKRKGKNQTSRPKSIKMTGLKKPAGRIFLAEEGGDMSNRTRQDLKVLKEFIQRHSRIVEQNLAKTGTSPRTALVASAAKYYPTLKKLAEK
jgi:hypothetical protein